MGIALALSGRSPQKNDQLPVVSWAYDVELAMHRKCTAFHETHSFGGNFLDFSSSVSRSKRVANGNLLHLSISPITMSRLPTMAGMSAIKTPRQSSPVTDRLQKHELLARARAGSASPSPTM